MTPVTLCIHTSVVVISELLYISTCRFFCIKPLSRHTITFLMLIINCSLVHCMLFC